MKKEKTARESRLETAMRIVGILVWIAIIVFVFLRRDRITVEAVLERVPENRWDAALLKRAGKRSLPP